jgi:hypothetical protein
VCPRRIERSSMIPSAAGGNAGCRFYSCSEAGRTTANVPISLAPANVAWYHFPLRDTSVADPESVTL